MIFQEDKLNSYKKKSGHRNWAPKNAPVAGRHTGDIMSSEKRSRLMSRIKGKNTRPEIIIFNILERKGVIFERHYKYLPGKPDIVFHNKKIAVFIDGDFWHGWRFPLWEHKLSSTWKIKIAQTRKRDQINYRKLRKYGWKVIRIWEHQIEKSPDSCIRRILENI